MTTNETPLSYYKRVVRPVLAPDECVVLTHDPRYPPHSWVAPRRTARVLAEGEPEKEPAIDDVVCALFWNAESMEDVKAATLKSLRAGRAVWFSCDIHHASNARLDVFNAAANSTPRLFGREVDAWDLDRGDALAACVISDTHAMTFIGHDPATDTWEVEDSAGGGKRSLTMTGAWFSRFVYSACVQRGYMDAKCVRRMRRTPKPTRAFDPPHA